ncbi:hypothetical protein SDC9_108776 [bioreactor metagenome]|uniref:Uncharacterized protein n=1 Tax=bioreactor metagenome TaxID=1076179 RepID=A0A645B917_9ZZZZ
MSGRFHAVHDVDGAAFYNLCAARQPYAVIYLLRRQKVLLGPGQRGERRSPHDPYAAFAADSGAAAMASDPNARRRRDVRGEFAVIRFGFYIVWHKGYYDLAVFVTHYDHPFANRSASSLMAPFL